MKSPHDTPSSEALNALKSLQSAIRKTLDRKRRLGHYTVQWQDNKVVIQGDDAPDEERQ